MALCPVGKGMTIFKSAPTPINFGVLVKSPLADHKYEQTHEQSNQEPFLHRAE